MFDTKMISPLDLKLDPQNPRFLIKPTSTQESIRAYLLENEDVVGLAKKITTLDKLLPGERIIVCIENSESIVLEGNRRTCVYQMLLDRSLIPVQHEKKIPFASPSLLNEISSLPIDVVVSRVEAAPYLVARHINGVRTWKPLPKWNVAYQKYKQGLSLEQISDDLSMTKDKVRESIRNMKLIYRCIESGKWTDQERDKLVLSTIEPSKILYFLDKGGLKKLGVSFAKDLSMKSSFYSEEILNLLFAELARQAFIDGTLDTRNAKVDDVWERIEHVIPESARIEAPQLSLIPAAPNPIVIHTPKVVPKATSLDPATGTFRVSQINIKAPTEPYFFDHLSSHHLGEEDITAAGLIRICRELKEFSAKKLVEKLPLSAIFLTRALIEQSFLYYAKRHNVQNQTYTIYSRIPNPENVKLSKLIDEYNKHGANYIPDERIRGFINECFKDAGDYKIQVLNWGIHQPSDFVLDSEKIIKMPNHNGFLPIIHYLIQ